MVWISTVYSLDMTIKPLVFRTFSLHTHDCKKAHVRPGTVYSTHNTTNIVKVIQGQTAAVYLRGTMVTC